MSEARRQSPRYAMEAAVELTLGPTVSRGRTDNISRGGLCAIVDKALERGAIVDVGLSLVFDEDTFSEPLTLPARVVWATSLGSDRHQVGTSFLNLTNEQKNYLEMFLRYLAQGDEDAEEDDVEVSDDPFA